ncbi:unnamed protein product, partial [Ilex paraguariensis]
SRGTGIAHTAGAGSRKQEASSNLRRRPTAMPSRPSMATSICPVSGVSCAWHHHSPRLRVAPAQRL